MCLRMEVIRNASILRFANITGVQMPEAFAGVGDLFSGAQITLGHVTLGNTMAEIYKSKCCLVWFCNPAVTRIPNQEIKPPFVENFSFKKFGSS